MDGVFKILVFLFVISSSIYCKEVPELENAEASLLITVNPSRQQLVDSLGREVYFHGSNVVYKHTPFHPTTSGYDKDSFSERDMEIMQSLGLNVIRLGMMLPGYVPKRGQYNETYIQVIREIVEKAAKYGIYTLLDMHQDVMSPKFCNEGFPDWAVNVGNADNFPFPFNNKYPVNPNTSYPYYSDCIKQAWGDYYFTQAVCAAFQNFYNNTDGLTDAWADFWKKTAAEFKDVNSVIGYELINEPWAGDIYQNPKLMIPGFADEINLAPAYEVVHRAIREVDEKHCVFFEGVTWDYFAVGFSNVPGGESYQNRSVLSYHYYEPPDFNKQFDFEVRMEDLARMKCGGFLTEFSTTGRSAKDIEGMTKIMDFMDQHKQSWMGWLYKPYGCNHTYLACLTDFMHNENGHINDDLVANTTRTYPQAVAGYTKSFNFDSKTKKFELVYEISSECKSKQSIIYFNQGLHYPKGYNIALTPEGAGEWIASENKILLTHSGTLKPGSNIKLELEAK